MVDLAQNRHLIINVSDRTGKPLVGADIVFKMRDAVIAEVRRSNGHGEVTLPISETDPIEVVVTYRGATQTGKFGPDQNHFEFKYNEDTSLFAGHLPLWVGIGFVLLAVALVVAIPHPEMLQARVLYGVFAIGAGGFATELSGQLNVQAQVQRFAIGAGGAMAVFVLLWLTNPIAG
ncbi:MAG: hypothetical protein JNJ63_06765 [Hyphomonadaceae bacterium]|nr:hypothetical protein [Hyphomonadaceae bacterium]